mmetsp:Transcript_49662/g.160583  ORF Transcript_49662/g.160583 Transcript_49662/m.160583 type:complete len:121 (-) Transcript_49662:139-501(-)
MALLAKVLVALSLVAAAADQMITSTTTTTPLPGSCSPPEVESDAETDGCTGVFPPSGTCMVQCKVGYTGAPTTYYCYVGDDVMEGVAPTCTSVVQPKCKKFDPEVKARVPGAVLCSASKV